MDSAQPDSSRSGDAVTTSFLLANLHCPTCVSTIRRIFLEPRTNGIQWVSPNMVTSWVTIKHDASVSVQDMANALKAAGFEICSFTTTGEEDAEMGQLDGGLDELGVSHLKGKGGKASAGPGAEAHLQNCKQCQLKQSGTSASSLWDPVSHTSTTTADHTSNLATVPPFIAVDNQTQDVYWKATLVIGGMTCASCSNAISEGLNTKDWVSKVEVNLISNSAVVEFHGEDNKDKIVEAITDLGYEAHLDQVVKLDTGKDGLQRTRTVEIRIDGFHCMHCPDRAASSILDLGGAVEIVRKPTQEWPIMKISYTPQPSTLNIRRILDVIKAGDPVFAPSIYHPPSLEERSKAMHAKHQRQIKYRVLLSFIVAIPTFIIGIVYMSLVPEHNPVKMSLMAPWTSGISRAQIALFIMATPVYFLAADIFHRHAIKELRSLWRRNSRIPFLQRFYRFGSMNMLMSLGTTIAYISSCCQLIAAAVEKPDMVNNANFYFDSVVFLTLFLLLGRLIESYSKSKTSDAVDMLGNLRPTTAILVADSKEGYVEEVVQTDLLDYGDVVRVPHGASPPCDGKVVQGETKFDESSLTGESRLIKKAMGDEVFSGTVNKGSPIQVQVTGASGQTMLDQIVRIVREGQTKRAPIEKIADVLTGYFVPVVTLVAVLTWLIWLILGTTGVLPEDYLDVSSGGWVAFSLQFAIAVFVVACPCGLGLAAPTAIFVGGGLAARYGILAKGGGEAFEKASRIDCIVFDKTGTLTKGGEPTVTDFELMEGQVDDSSLKLDVLLASIRAVEKNSTHPIAKAIVSYCKSKTEKRMNVSNVDEIPGKGIKAGFGVSTERFEIIVGNETLLKDYDVAVPPTVADKLTSWQHEAKSIALAATKPTGSTSRYALAAAFSISDPVRTGTASVIQGLRGRGIDVWMLSGDNTTTARAVAQQIGIETEHVISEVLPAEKASKITYLQATLKARAAGGKSESMARATVAMVGDGINDAPALAVADVGIAVGSGSDVAISSADFVLISSNSGTNNDDDDDNDLWAVVTLVDLSKAVFRRILFNFGWALVYNLLAVPVAAGCFYALRVNGSHVRLDPVWASLAMALSSISVVLSSLALGGSRIPLIGFRKRGPG